MLIVLNRWIFSPYTKASASDLPLKQGQGVRGDYPEKELGKLDGLEKYEKKEERHREV